MKIYAGLILMLLLAGCLRKGATLPTHQSNLKTNAVIALGITNTATIGLTNVVHPKKPSFILPKPLGFNVLQGTVVRVDLPLKFAVIEFFGGALPKKNQQLSIHRAGLKVGEVKMGGPFQASSAVGDITTGTAAIGDAVQME